VTLAYVFSHRPGAAVEVGAYEDALRRFHSELARARPSGFIGSTTYRIGDGYSDWYLVESSAALDALNDAAVSGARASPHDAAARMAAGGAGKLMNLASGEPDLKAGFEIRFAKPGGMAYADLYRRAESWTGSPGVSLWRRMMVLGPPPEFCLVSRTPVELPADTHPQVIARKPIWR
jgi:hypothetical protein